MTWNAPPKNNDAKRPRGRPLLRSASLISAIVALVFLTSATAKAAEMTCGLTALAPPDQPESLSQKREQHSFETITFVVDRAIFDAVCEFLSLSTEQRIVADARYTAYLNRLSQIEEESRARRAEAGGAELDAMREVFWERIAQHSAITQDNIEEIRQLEAQYQAAKEHYQTGVKEEYRRAEELARKAADELLLYIAAILDEAQAHLMPRVAPLVRRRLFLTNPPTRGDFWLPDLFRLLKEAQAPGEELSQLPGAPQVHAALDQILLEYERRLDSYLVKRMEDRWEGLGADEAARWEAREGRARNWGARYRVTTTTLARITALFAEHFGEPTARAFRDRFDRFFCPRIFHQSWADVAESEWLPNEDLTPEQRDALIALFARYRSEYEVLQRRAMRAGATAKIEAGLFARTKEYLRFAERLVALRACSDRYWSIAQSLLSSDQRRSLAAHLSDPSTGRLKRALFGPVYPRPAN